MEEYKTEYCCKECGSTNIQIQAWVNPNTEDKDFIDFVALSIPICWCNKCDTTRIYNLNEIKIN